LCSVCVTHVRIVFVRIFFCVGRARNVNAGPRQLNYATQTFESVVKRRELGKEERGLKTVKKNTQKVNTHRNKEKTHPLYFSSLTNTHIHQTFVFSSIFLHSDLFLLFSTPELVKAVFSEEGGESKSPCRDSSLSMRCCLSLSRLLC
jgi:hypothetical protein